VQRLPLAFVKLGIVAELAARPGVDLVLGAGRALRA
jgi:hypothetical protein